MASDKMLGGCVYAPGGVNCTNKTNCDKCGWNPAEQDRRKARIDAGERPVEVKKP